LTFRNSGIPHHLFTNFHAAVRPQGHSRIVLLVSHLCVANCYLLPAQRFAHTKKRPKAYAEPKAAG
jgi:hypothetical protein